MCNPTSNIALILGFLFGGAAMGCTDDGLAIGTMADAEAMADAAAPADSEAMNSRPSFETLAATGRVHIVDDVDHMLPSRPRAPDGSTGFIWAKGIGDWFVNYGDYTHSAAPVAAVEPPRAGSMKAFRVPVLTDSGGADLWAQLNHPDNRGISLVDYIGLSIWVRVDGPASNLTVALDSRYGGGYFRARDKGEPLPAVIVPVTPQWQQVLVYFDDFATDLSSIISVDFVLDADVDGRVLWIDQLSFLCREPCNTDD